MPPFADLYCVVVFLLLLFALVCTFCVDFSGHVVNLANPIFAVRLGIVFG